MILLSNVNGIGIWTINVYKLVLFKSWDLYPEGDAFIAKKIQKLYQLSNKASNK